MRNGNSGTLDQFDIIATIKDDGTNYPGTTFTNPDNWGVQRVFSFTSNALKIQPAQVGYPTAEEAIAGIDTEGFIIEPSIAANGLLIGYIVLEKAMTDLANATFIQAGKFGTGGGGSGGVDISGKVNIDGSSLMTGALQMNTNLITGVVDPTNPQEASTKAYTDTKVGSITNAGTTTLVSASTGALKGLVAGTNITFTPTGTDITIDGTATDISGKVNIDGTSLMTGALQMNTNLITGVVDPTNPQEASTKAYTDTKVGSITNAGTTSLVSASTGALKGLVAGSNITLTPTGTDITIDATGGGAPSNLVIASKELSGTTTGASTDAGVNILSATFLSVHPDTNCVVVNSGATTGIQVQKAGSYKLEGLVTVEIGVGAPVTQYVELQICKGTVFDTNTLVKKESLLPYDNDKIEQSIGCVVELALNDIVSFWLNPNSANVGGAVNVSADIGTNINIYSVGSTNGTTVGSVATWDVIPFVMSNLLILGNSYDYYMNVRSILTKTLSTFEIQVGSGTDAYRVAIYTGSGTSAVLKCQSINTTGLGIGLHSLPLIAEVGQDLIIEEETDYVVAMSVDGTSGRPLGFTGISDTNIAWINTTDVNVGGFPVNPQTQSATTIRFCCRLF
jgi:hypothetical protein